MGTLPGSRKSSRRDRIPRRRPDKVIEARPEGAAMKCNKTVAYPPGSPYVSGNQEVAY